MSNILIVGDSWGCGEWNVLCTEILHKGLEQFLIDDGHTVVNISKGGCSNLDMVHRLNLWFERFDQHQIDNILVFQSEYTRDIKHAEDDDWQVKTLEQLASRWIARFYMRLSELAEKHKVSVKIIGGCSDTQWFDCMPNDHPGCEILCQSMTNLLLNDDHRVQVPVFSWYGSQSGPVLEKITGGPELIQEKLQAINLGFERQSLLSENPALFFPDGKHPNRFGHQKLFDFLREKL